MLKSLITSTILGCLLMSAANLPAQALKMNTSGTPPLPMIDPNFPLKDEKAIGQAVLKDAIATQQVDNTARIEQIERTGKGDIWMYNPVPYWKVTLQTQNETLVYYTTQEGRFRALVLRIGRPPELVGQPSQMSPSGMTSTALSQVRKIWGYSIDRNPSIKTEKVTWTSGCENMATQHLCDPMVHQGWKITVMVRDTSLVFRGKTVRDLQLIERTSPIERRLPEPVLKKAKELAGKQYNLSPNVIGIETIELQTYSDSCLGLGGPAENCARTTVKGYRVSILGKAKQRRTYRISNDGKIWRAESLRLFPA